MLAKIVFLVLCSLCFGCSHSPAKHYYLLNARPSAPQAVPATSRNITLVIGIGPIEIADYLNRPKMLVNQPANGGDTPRLLVAENDYWAEPLAKGVARVLALDLMQRDANRSFIHYPWSRDNSPRLSLRVHIISLTFSNNQMSLIANWQLMDNKTGVRLENRNLMRTTPLGPGPENLALAFSQLVDGMAGDMDTALQANLQ